MDWIFIGKMLLGAFWNSSNVFLSIPSWLAVIPIFTAIFLPKRGKKMKTKKEQEARTTKIRIWSVVAIIALLFISLILSAQQLYKDKQLTFATPDALIPLNLSGLQINVADLARNDLTIKNKTFNNCDLYGPAVIAMLGDYVVVTGNTFDASIDTMFTVQDTDRWISGVIAFENVQFINCRFHKIGIIGSSTMKQQFLSGTK
ncbi:MAG: hypothetical protein Q7J73_08985 [Dehalococcoidales bacterium]|nr:hypothetical protein [Dehalococcoidales bacterium]